MTFKKILFKTIISFIFIPYLSQSQNITTFSNTATNPSQLYPSMSKALPSMQTHGEISGKNTRERAIDCQRNSPAMVEAFNQNPYSHSLQSWA